MARKKANSTGVKNILLTAGVILLGVFIFVGTNNIGTNMFSWSSAAGGVLAFPTAEGYGANSVGGRGGTVMEVTNLNDSGTGSLRACITATGPRICVFRIGGLLQLSSPLTISNPYITVAGQSAPGGGITLKSAGDIFLVKTHDVVIRYLSIRPGPGGSNHGAQIASNGSNSVNNVIFDHCSISWGVDSDIETWYRVYDTTIQWSIISEGLDCSTHPKGCHSKGLMIGGYAGSESKNSIGSENISVLHNLMAHNADRNPLMQLCGAAQVVNNVTYDAAYTFSHQQDNCIVTAVNYVNWIGNYHKKGPDSTSNTDLKVIPADSGTYSNQAKVYVKGNIGPSRTSDSLPDEYWVDSGSRRFVVTQPGPGPAVLSTDAQTAYNSVLADAGNNKGINCDGAWFNRRDAIDTRIINDVKNGTGHVIDNPSQVGGWITPASGIACTDSDHDGMPDVWEIKYALNPTNSADARADNDSDGYTNIEEYLNGTDPGSATNPIVIIPTVASVPTVAVTKSPTPVRTSNPTVTPTRTPTRIPTATTRVYRTPTATPVRLAPSRVPTAAVSGNTLVFIPTDDAEIDQAYPSWNRGRENELNVDGKPVEQILLKFQVSGVNGRKIRSATLKLYAIHQSLNSGGIFRRITDNSWSQSSVTWNNRPSIDSSEIGSLGRIDIGNWYTVNLTPIITGDGTYGFNIYSNSEDGGGYVSSEGSSSQRPRLEIVVE